MTGTEPRAGDPDREAGSRPHRIGVAREVTGR